MKKIAIKVEIEVPDDYVIDEPDWTLEEAISGDFEYSTQEVAVSQEENSDEEDTMVSLDDVHQFLIYNMYTEMDEGDYSYGEYEINWTDYEDRKNPNPLSKFLDLLDEAVIKK